eukprot:6199677-Pleurochrysis_carterae.AAC.2
MAYASTEQCITVDDASAEVLHPMTRFASQLRGSALWPNYGPIDVCKLTVSNCTSQHIVDQTTSHAQSQFV